MRARADVSRHVILCLENGVSQGRLFGVQQDGRRPELTLTAASLRNRIGWATLVPRQAPVVP